MYITVVVTRETHVTGCKILWEITAFCFNHESLTSLKLSFVFSLPTNRLLLDSQSAAIISFPVLRCISSTLDTPFLNQPEIKPKT